MDCKVSRTVGDKCGPGEFLVEDWDNDMQWQLRVISREPDRRNPRGLAVVSEVVCLTHSVEPDVMLAGDLYDAVRDAIEEEFAERDGDSENEN